MDPVVEGVGVCVGGKLGVKVAVMTVVSPAASIVVYLYTVCWPGIVGAGKPTGPCCTSGVVDVLVVDCAAMVCMVAVVNAPAKGFVLMTSTMDSPN